MSLQLLIISELTGLCLLAWLINLTRTKKLYVGFSVLGFIAVISLMIIVAIHYLTSIIGYLAGIKISVLNILFLFNLFIVIVLINLSKQISILTNRVTDIAQYIAMEENRQKNQRSTKECEGSETHNRL